jgi:hypothetical protein
MGRRGGGKSSVAGNGRSTHSTRAPATNQRAPATQQQHHPPAPTPAAAAAVVKPSDGGFTGALVQGFGWGAGSAIARSAVEGVLGTAAGQAPQPLKQGPGQQQSTNQAGDGHCASLRQDLFKCFEDHRGNVDSCQLRFDLLMSCERLPV